MHDRCPGPCIKRACVSMARESLGEVDSPLSRQSRGRSVEDTVYKELWTDSQQPIYRFGGEER